MVSIMNQKFAHLVIAAFLLIFTACSTARLEMPITTSSEEALGLFITGRDLNENGERFTGDSILMQAIDLDPDFALAHLYLSMGDGINNAKSLASKVTPGEKLLIQAYGARQSGNTNLAVITIDSLINLFPKDKHCLYYANKVYYRNNADKALEYLYKAIKSDPYYAAAYNLLGYELIELQRYDEAREAFLRYLDIYPESENIIDSYAEMLFITGEEREALNQYKKVKLYDPTNSFVNVKIAWLNIFFENYIEAVNTCTDLYNSDPASKEKEWGVCMMANIEFIQGNLSGALEIMDSYIQQLYEENNLYGLLLAIHQKGWYALRGDVHNLAIEFFTDGIELINDSINIADDENMLVMGLHGGLSVAYGEMLMKEKSKYHLNIARSLYAAYGPQYYSKGLLNSYEAAYDNMNGNYDMAISHLTSPATSVSSAQKYYLAKTNDLSGNKEQAILFYNKLIKSLDQYFAGFFYNESRERLSKLSQ